MYQKMQSGRSMIEMLGVLAITGILSIGGFNIVAKAMKNQRYSKIIADVSEMASSAKKLSCQFLDDGGYSDYGIFLYKSAKYPEDLTYLTEGDDTGKFLGVLDVLYKIEVGDNGASSFKITLEKVPTDLCIRITTDNWGTVNSTGFKELSIGEKTVSALDMVSAAVDCANDFNTITLSYYGCRKEM